MEKHFVTYKQALALKELGFDEPCMGKYDTKQGNEWFLNIYSGHLNTQFGDKSKACIAPLKSQVFDWFRSKHNLRHNVMDFIDDITGIEWDYEIATIGTDLDESGNYIPLVDYSIDDETRKFKTYEEAESACIDKLIEIIKKK